jgi:hypothetical protein
MLDWNNVVLVVTPEEYLRYLRCLKKSVFNTSFHDSRQIRQKVRLVVAGFLLEYLFFNPTVRHVGFVVDQATLG